MKIYPHVGANWPYEICQSIPEAIEGDGRTHREEAIKHHIERECIILNQVIEPIRSYHGAEAMSDDSQ